MRAISASTTASAPRFTPSFRTTKPTGTSPRSGSGSSDHGALGNGVMPRQRLLQLPRRQAMARDVNHIIGAAHNEYVAVLVP